MIIDTIFC